MCVMRTRTRRFVSGDVLVSSPGCSFVRASTELSRGHEASIDGDHITEVDSDTEISAYYVTLAMQTLVNVSGFTVR